MNSAHKGRGRVIARTSFGHDRPLYVLIRSLRGGTSRRESENWRILDCFRTRQEALKAIAEHQRDPKNTRQYQYRVA